jgi:hypothetical protein
MRPANVDHHVVKLQRFHFRNPKATAAGEANYDQVAMGVR